MPDTNTATIEASEDAVRDAALRADAGEPAETPDVDTTETDTQTSPETNGKPAEQGSDETDTTSETDADKPESPEKKPDVAKPNAKPESAYTKAQKEKQRQENTWKKLEAEKQAHREQVARFEAERAEFQRRTQTATQTPPPAANTEPQGPSAEAYDALAKQYEQEGNADMAQAARDKATEVREKAKQQPPQQQATAARPADPANDPQFKAAWNGHVADLVKQHPHLNDPANPLGKATMGLINSPAYGRFFRAHPDGIKMAHEVALLQRDAAQAKTLTVELTKAKAEVDRLTKLTSLRGAPPPSGAGGGKTSVTDLNGEAAEDFVRQAAMKADRGESP